MQNLRASAQRLSFLRSVQYDVIKSVLQGLKGFNLRWQQSLSAEVNKNVNLGYSQDQGYF